MSETKTKAAQEETNPSAKKTAPSSKSSINNKKLAKSSLPYLIIAVLVVLLVLAFAYWHQQQQQTAKQLAQLQQQLSDLSQQHQQSSNAITQLQSKHLQTISTLSAVQATQQQQQQLLNNMQTATSQLHHQLLGDNSAWLVSEALYLSKLANYTLIFQHDSATSVSLLNTADQLLRRTASPKILSVRQVIANAVTQLQSTTELDVGGLYVKLQALAVGIRRLPMQGETLFGDASSRQSVLPQQNNAPSSSTWQQRLAFNAKQVWQHLVIVQHQASPMAAQLTGQQQSLLNQYSLLLVGQAQTAVLKQNQKIYQSSLTQLSAMLKQYYDAKQITVQKMLSQIERLQTISVSAKMPDLSSVILAIQQFQQQLNQQKVTDNKDNATSQQPQSTAKAKQ